MQDGNGIVKAIRNFLEANNLDPFYTATLFSIIISLSYWKDYKNWKNRPNWVKGLAGSTLAAAIVFSIISLLRLVEIVNF